jgi:putative ATP-grasp target RiPP
MSKSVQAHGEASSSLRPWGVSRMSAYAPAVLTDVMVVGIDPATQLAIYRSGGGESGLYHSMGTSTRGRLTETSPPDGRNPSPPDRDHADDAD